MSENSTPIVELEKARMVAGRLVTAYVEACDRARLNYGTAAELLGVSRSRLTTLRKEAKTADGPNVTAHLFLCLVKSVERIEQGLAEGWLPAAGVRDDEAQAQAGARLRGQ